MPRRFSVETIEKRFNFILDHFLKSDNNYFYDKFRDEDYSLRLRVSDPFETANIKLYTSGAILIQGPEGPLKEKLEFLKKKIIEGYETELRNALINKF